MSTIPYSRLDIPAAISSRSQNRKRKLILFALSLLLFVAVIVAHKSSTSVYPFSIHQGDEDTHYNAGIKEASRRHVAVASDFQQHFDVHLAAAHTLNEVLGAGGNVSVFAHTPLFHGFQEVVDTLGLYEGSIRSPDDFLSATASSTLYPDEPGAMIELVVFGTCEVE